MQCSVNTYNPDNYLMWDPSYGLTVPPMPQDYAFPLSNIAWYNCDSSYGPTTTTAMFAFVKEWNAVALNQTWICDDDGNHTWVIQQRKGWAQLSSTNVMNSGQHTRL